MAVVVRQKSVEYISNLISRGQVDTESSWSFEADDENRLIEEKGWETFVNVHLAYDDEGSEDAKSTYKFPVAKLKGDTVTVFRRGVIAAKQRAAQQGYDNVYAAASKLLDQIDEKYSEEKQAEKKEERTFEFPRVSYRDAEIREVQSDRFVVSVSSETEVERFGYYEVLSHTKEAIVDDYLRNGIAVLVNHDRDKIIGISEGYEIRDGKLYVTYRLSKTAEPWKTLIEEGILRHTSIGYEILEYEQIGTRDGLPVIQVTRWRPLEFSFVSIPADITVGVGRQKEVGMNEEKEKQAEKTIEVIEPERREKMPEKIINANTVNVPVEREYSLHRVITALMENRTLDGYEGEIAQELEHQLGRRAKGVYVPFDVFTRASDYTGLKLTQFTGLVGEYPIQGSLEKAGATVIRGLQGTATVGIMGVYPTVTWGNTSPTASDTNIKGYELIPNTASVWTTVYRSILKQSTPDIEKYLRQILGNTITTGIEKAVLQGSGHASNQPLGLVSFTLGTGFGVNTSQTAGTNTWAYSDIANMYQNVLGKVENPMFIMPPALFGTLKSTVRETGYPVYIIDQANTIDGIPVLVHAGMPANTIALGDPSTILMAYWGAIDVIVNPYAGGPSIRVEAYVEFDSAVIVPTAWHILTLKTS
jgi:phage head maturation protease